MNANYCIYLITIYDSNLHKYNAQRTLHIAAEGWE